MRGRALTDAPRRDSLSFSPAPSKTRRPPRSSFSVESPGRAQSDWSSSKRDVGITCEQSSTTTLVLGGQFMDNGADSLVVLDTGAAANLDCL